MRNKAITVYKSALTHWPENISMLFALANAYYSSNQPSSAEQIYRRILLIDFTYLLAKNNLADLLRHTERTAEALRLIDEAVTDDLEIESIIKIHPKR